MYSHNITDYREFDAYFLPSPTVSMISSIDTSSALAILKILANDGNTLPDSMCPKPVLLMPES